MAAWAVLAAYWALRGPHGQDPCRLCDGMRSGAIHSTVSGPIWHFSVHFEHKVRSSVAMVAGRSTVAVCMLGL